MKKTITDLGGNLTDLPNQKYAKLFESFKEIETLEVSQWETNHILGYFVKKYKDHYNLDYKFKFNSPAPSKCFEIFQIKKLAMILSSDPTILKNYIDWVYQNKVVQAKKRLTSISFLTREESVQDYKMNIVFADNKTQSISRSVPLPDDYQQIFQEFGFMTKTYGDLAFLFQMEKTPELSNAFTKLRAWGFDDAIVGLIV